MEPETLQPDQVKLWASHLPNLQVGDYTFMATQTIQPTSDSSDIRKLSTLTQRLSVPGPKFKLLHSSDVHSVYPVAGSNETGAILAHVTLKHSTLAWERQVVFDGDYKPDDSRNVPWLAVISFTEDELVLSEAGATTLGFPSGSVPSRYGTIDTTPSQLKLLDNIASPLWSPNFENDYNDTDSLDALCIQPSLFQELFQPVSGGKAYNDIVPYQYMAHVRHSQSSSDIISIVISPRSGPTRLIKPGRMISHLVSLEGIPQLDVSASPTSVALVSLYSWDWMCTPPAPTTPRDILAALGNTVQPLRVSGATLAAVGTSTPPATWLHDRLQAGYTIKPYTDPSGNKTSCILRGPLIPVPETADPSFAGCCSDNGKDLVRFDSATGLHDLTMASAWTIGRSMALGDKSFLASLMRLRGKIRAEAVRQAKAASRDAGGSNIWTNQGILSNLATTLAKIAEAHSDTYYNSVTGPIRWNNQQASSQIKQQQQIVTFSKLDPATYLKQLGSVVSAFFATSTLDTDASVVQSWILKRLFLEGIPPSYLIMTPDQFPQESIRTFSIDSTWVSLLVDGALSLANHHSRNGDDDVIRKYIKSSINLNLALPLPDEQPLQRPPRWGLLIRSSLVSSFPDFKVQGSSTPYDDPSTSKSFLQRKLAPDIMLCLSDFRPGDPDFSYLRISLPIHRQTYQLGDTLTESDLSGDFKLPPTSADPSTYGHSGKCQWASKQSNLPYNWTSRILEPLPYAQQIYKSFGKTPPTTIDSTTLALFLGRPTPSLKLEVGEMSKPLPATPPPYLPVTLPSSMPSSPAHSPAESVTSKKSLPVLTKSSSPKALSVAASSQASLPTTDTNIAVVLLKCDQAFYHKCPATTNISDIFTPQYHRKLKTLQGSGLTGLAKNDIVFTLSDDGPRSTQNPDLIDKVDYIRIVIPVTGAWFPSSGTITIAAVLEDDGSTTKASIDTSKPTLLSIPGSLSSPVLPRIHSLDQSQEWVFQRYLALSRMYKTAGVTNGGQVAVSKEDPVLLVLVIEGKPRFDLGGGQFDAGFVLQDAILVQTPMTSYYDTPYVGVNVILKAKDTAVQELSVNVMRINSKGIV
ncbi:hypothetical protein FGADI_734 [Fusarium gaditjirri]|uniref:Uncharacterized protein n=1 Tax=Fusarium gaditjirri TaxID=282569 RepID=A0A8H4TMT5_9HYPO|nr:hypothetical protein FGADI_734 [Fusarium gaditjirri]